MLKATVPNCHPPRGWNILSLIPFPIACDHAWNRIALPDSIPHPLPAQALSSAISLAMIRKPSRTTTWSIA